MGVTLENDDWEDMVSLAQAFDEQEAKGQQFILEVKKSQSKDKSKEYTNYVFAAYADNDEEISISNEDLPF